MSKSLIKLLDNAILPAALLVVSKFLGILLVAQIFSIDLYIEQSNNNILSFQTILSSKDTILVTSYSDLLMFGLVALGFSLNLILAIFFHNTHIKPITLMKLSDRNLLNLVKSSYELYHSGSIWLLFLWISTFIITANVFNNLAYPWVAILSVVVSIVLTTIFLQDVYREIENIKKHPKEYLKY